MRRHPHAAAGPRRDPPGVPPPRRPPPQPPGRLAAPEPPPPPAPAPPPGGRTAPRWAQLESKATKFGRRTPADGRIDWRQSAEDVRNLVRAVTKPYPGAFSFARGERVLVWWAAHAPEAARAAAGTPGTVRVLEDGVFVLCGDRRLLRLARVEIGGKEGDPLEFPGVLRDGGILAGSPEGVG